MHSRLDGAGARISGGRWNSRGKPMVYMAESIALAVLENLVHMAPGDFPAKYVVVGAQIPDDLPALTDRELIARTGLNDPRLLGDFWLDSHETAVLAVSSVVVPAEHNFLLNPSHPDFSRMLLRYLYRSGLMNDFCATLTKFGVVREACE